MASALHVQRERIVAVMDALSLADAAEIAQALHLAEQIDAIADDEPPTFRRKHKGAQALAFEKIMAWLDQWAAEKLIESEPAATPLQPSGKTKAAR